MSWVSLFVVALAGLVSSVAAISIAAVILLVVGQIAVLVYRSLASSKAAPKVVARA